MADPTFLVFSNRMMRAAALDASVYEEIEADPSAVRQSLAVVLLSSMAAGIGAGGWQGSSLRTFVLFTLIALATWTAWAWLVAEIGRRLLPEPQTSTSFAELLRTIGFAATPGLFQIFAAMPSMTVPVFGVTAVWMLVAMVIAVRQALDYRHTARALAVCAVGWTLALVMAFVLGVMFGPTVS
jgi:hypothetical protein